MAINFTEDQQRVIDTRNKNILVSAAAGSGKTAVLVERIIERIMDREHPVDIDKLLVVTFTNAAAAGMKERISNAILKRLASEPENTHLQRQAVLVHQAQITTIHSFCLYLIRNHFEAISLEPDFKVADEPMMKLMSCEVREEILEEAFARAEEDFLYMVEFVCHNGRESVLEEYIEQLYARAMSMPFPKRWLLERVLDYDFTDLDSFTGTESGKYLLLHIQGLLKSYHEAYGYLYRVATESDGPYMYADLLEEEQEYLQKLLEQDSLDNIGKLLPTMPFNRLSSKKDDSVNAGKRKWVAERRNLYKKAIQALGEQFFGKSPQSIAVENEACRRVTKALVELTITYMERLAEQKRKKGLIDFHDMEHMALEILLRETKDGYETTEIAKGYQEFFEEVMIDEYQDSNMVQEYIVTAVSGESLGKFNRFMVGDVKQSIYKFRLARPEIFMEKYHSYAGEKDSSLPHCVRIDLKKNFRSREQVLDATNRVFSRVMLPQLGGIAYDEHAALYKGATFLEAPGMEAECIVAGPDKPEHYSNKQWEAYCTAKRIQELIRTGQVLSEDGKSLRPVTYQDIVLLFRSPASYEEAYKDIFAQMGIPLYVTSGSGYFDTAEIRNLMKLLQAVENPRQDIPLFGVCTSLFGGLDENQLATVKVHYTKQLSGRAGSLKRSEKNLYEMLCMYQQDFPEDAISKKIAVLLDRLEKYRKDARFMPVVELLYEIIGEYHYREYIRVLPDGEKRLANVELLLERAANFGAGASKTLFAFNQYTRMLQKQAVDYGEASASDHTNAVRVMSIHKSKGLEFPVVFVCGIGQSYQMRDKQQMILIDNDMGLGMDYINPARRSKNKTMRKHVIALKMEHEILAEEQRILYVAMTRAREKLIMTGYSDKEEAEEMAEVSAAQGPCLLSDVLAAKSYLDLCLLAKRNQDGILWKYMSAADFEAYEITEAITLENKKLRLEERIADTAEVSSARTKAYDERFTYRYGFNNLRDLYSKTSVSELKRAAIREDQEAVYDAFEKANELELVPYIPEFMKEKQKVLGAERGTAYHRVMELLDFKAPPRTYEQWQQALEAMEASGKLTDRQRECIYIPKMQEFMQSRIAGKIAKSDMQGKLHREQSFFLGIPANEVNAGFPASETMLVQGVVDVYLEEEDGLVLVDYKTDRVENGEELIERYRVQMKYYKKALEQALGRKVKEIALYSLHLGKEVYVPIV